jgi:hypothetical protein
LKIKKSDFLKAFAISAIIAVIFTFLQAIIFGGGAKYVPAVEWSQIESMTYSDATNYLMERSQKISGFESFINGLGFFRFWVEIFKVWLLSTIYGFICCSILILLNKNKSL